MREIGCPGSGGPIAVPKVRDLLPWIHGVASLVQDAPEVGTAGDRPIALAPGAEQFGIVGAARAKLVAILIAIDELIADERRRRIDPQPAGFFLFVRRPGRGLEGIPLGEPMVPYAARVGRDYDADRHVFRAAEIRAQNVEQRRVGILPGFVDQEQRERAALIFGIVGVRLQLPELQIGAVREAPDVLRGIVARRAAVDRAEQVARDQLEVGEALIGLANVEDPRGGAVLLGMAQR